MSRYDLVPCPGCGRRLAVEYRGRITTCAPLRRAPDDLVPAGMARVDTSDAHRSGARSLGLTGGPPVARQVHRARIVLRRSVPGASASG